MSNLQNQLNMSNLALTTTNNALKVLLILIEKAQNHAQEKNIKDETILGLRIIADMFPLSAQIRIVTDNAKGAIARLAGVEIPVFEDTETTIEQFKARIIKAQNFIASIDPKLLENSDNKEIILKFPNQTFEFVGLTYVTGFFIPNINFHLTTAYNILRANGVNLGKTDYLLL